MTQEELEQLQALQIPMAPAPTDDVGFVPQSWAPATPRPNVNPPPKPTPAATPRDIFSQGVDPSTFMLSPEQEQARSDKQSQVAIFQALSNQFANSANSWKPGSVDTGANGKLFQSYQNQIDEPIHALERKKSAYQSSEAIEQRRLANESVKSKMDPASNVSAGLRLQVAQKARSGAALMPDSPVAAQLSQLADAYEKGSQSGLDAERQLAAIDKLIGPALSLKRSDSIENQGKDKLSLEHEKLAAEQSRRAAEMAQKERFHGDEMKLKYDELARKAGAMHLKVAKAQDKLNREVGDVKMMIDSLANARELKKNVNTGKFIEPAAQIGEDYLGIVNKDRVKLRNELANSFEALRKSQFGSTFTANEEKLWNNMVASLKNDDEKFDVNLDAMESFLYRKLSSRIDEYQRLDDTGALVDTSNMAAKVTKQQPKLTPGERGGSDPNIARAQAVIADPGASPKAKAGAQKYLRDHGQAN